MTNRYTRTPAERFWSFVDKRGDDECWVWVGYRNASGYGVFKVNGRTWLAHRYLQVILTGKEPSANVLHHCDNPACCNPAHLFLGTVADNNADMTRKGRRRGPVGTDVNTAKLTPDQVREIRRLCRAGAKQRDVAARYGVQEAAVGKIMRGRTWKHLDAAQDSRDAAGWPAAALW